MPIPFSDKYNVVILDILPGGADICNCKSSANE